MGEYCVSGLAMSGSGERERDLEAAFGVLLGESLRASRFYYMLRLKICGVKWTLCIFSSLKTSRVRHGGLCLNYEHSRHRHLSADQCEADRCEVHRFT